MRRRIIIFTIITIGIILIVSALDHTFSRSYHHMLTRTTDLGKENIENLFLNDDFYSEEISQKYGRKTEQSRNVTNYDYFELTEGIEVAVNKTGRISRFIITDSKLETAKGIKIGDEKNDIVKAYGKNFYFRSEQGADIIGYIDKQRKISLEFWLFNDKVNFYRLDISSME